MKKIEDNKIIKNIYMLRLILGRTYEFKINLILLIKLIIFLNYCELVN